MSCDTASLQARVSGRWHTVCTGNATAHAGVTKIPCHWAAGHRQAP